MAKGAAMRLLTIEDWQGLFVVELLHMWRSAILGANVIGDGRATCYIAVIICCICSVYQPAGFEMLGTNDLSSTIFILTFLFHDECVRRVSTSRRDNL